MKKLFLVLAAAAIASGAYAEGYQVNNMSAKQTGMGHVGTAMKLTRSRSSSTPQPRLSRPRNSIFQPA